MKKVLDVLPFALLLILTPLFYYKSPTIAHSMIILAVSGLCAFRYHQMESQKPDFVALFKKELNILEKEVREVKADYSKLNIGDIKKKEERSFYF